MHFLHESVEMRAAFGFDGERFVEQIHQHGLSAPDAAPHVDARCTPGLFAKYARQEPPA